MISFFHPHELIAMKIFHTIRNPVLDLFFIGWNYVDSWYFHLFLVGLIWSFFGQRWGVRILATLILMSYTVLVSKNFFALPRPCTLDPSLGLILFRNYGFPSGAATTSVLIPGILLSLRPRTWIAASAVIFGVILSFSRVYLGVHFFTDLVGGWILGSVLLFLYLQWHEKIEALLTRFPFWSWLIGSQLLPLCCITVHQNPQIFILAGMWMGMGSAVFLLHKEGFHVSLFSTLWQKVVAMSLITGGVFAWHSVLFLFVSKTPIYLLFYGWMASFWALYLVPHLAAAAFTTQLTTRHAKTKEY